MRLKYTIFIPAYKADKHIVNFCCNILRQTAKPDQIVIIDDTKNSEFFFDKIKKKFSELDKKIDITLIKNNTNLNAPISWNRYRKLFKNKLVFRMDVDDYWYPTHAVKMLNFYKLNKKSAVYTQMNECSLIKKLFFNYQFIGTNQALHSSCLFNFNVCDIIYPVTNYAIDDLFIYIKLKYLLKKRISFVKFNTCKIITNAPHRWSNAASHGKKKIKLERKLYLYALKKKFMLKKFKFIYLYKIFFKFSLLQSIYIISKLLYMRIIL